MKYVNLIFLFLCISGCASNQLRKREIASIGLSRGCHQDVLEFIKLDEYVKTLIFSDKKDPRKITSINLNNDLSLKELKEVEEVFHTVNQKLIDNSNFFKHPENMYALISKEERKPSFRIIGRRDLTTGKKFVKRSKNGHSVVVDVELTNAITAHEYGHAIFQETFEHHVPRFKALIDMEQKRKKIKFREKYFRKLKVRLEDDLERILDQKFSLSISDTELESLNIKYSDKSIELKKMEKKVFQESSKLEKLPLRDDAFLFIKIMDPYNEFFADLTAVIFANFQDDVMYRALDVSNIKYGPQISNGQLQRDFSYVHNRLDLWIPNVNSHTMFAPAKYHLYREYLTDTKYHTKEGRIILYEKVFKAMIAEIEYRFDNPTVLKTIKSWNRDLMDRIDLEFQSP